MRDDMEVREIFIQATRRIDGITMYIVCLVFLLFCGYSQFAKYFNIPNFSPLWKVSLASFLMLPITFILYVSLAYFSVSGKISRAINATILAVIPFYFFYKFWGI